jgi:hypothetical protein
MSTDYVDGFRIGRVASRTFSVIGRNAVMFLVAAALLLSPVALLAIINGTPSALAGGVANGFLMGTLAFLVGVVCTYLLQAALVHSTITDLNGGRPALGSALSTAFGVALPVIVISVLALLGMMAGMVLLIVPGIILALAWCVAVPVRVVEGTGIGETFGRSRELTKGFRWPIFGLLLIYAILAILLSLLALTVSGIGFAQAGQVQHGNIAYLVINWVLQVVLAVITAVGVTSIYYELRMVKEGVAPQQLAAAFD